MCFTQTQNEKECKTNKRITHLRNDSSIIA